MKITIDPKYDFSNDWFQITAGNWDKFPKTNRALEVGSFEGQSTVWIMENLLTDDGHIYCIDTWMGGEEHNGIDFRLVEQRFDRNVNTAKRGDQHVYKIRQPSYLGLSLITNLVNHFGFIYIDGSHKAKDVLTDACLAWPLLQSGGVMVFDDYVWGTPRDVLHRPKMAIDCFTTLFAEELNIIELGSQLAVQKI